MIHLNDYFTVQKTDRYLRMRLWKLNIYFSLHPLRTRKEQFEGCSHKNKRKRLKQRLIEKDPHCAICGKALTWEIASVHHIIPRSQCPEKEFDKDNLLLLCHPCHVDVHRRMDLEEKAQKHGSNINP